MVVAVAVVVKIVNTPPVVVLTSVIVFAVLHTAIAHWDVQYTMERSKAKIKIGSAQLSYVCMYVCMYACVDVCNQHPPDRLARCRPLSQNVSTHNGRQSRRIMPPLCVCE